METILTALIPVTFVLMLVVERVFPGRPLPRVRGWLLKGFAFFVMTAVINAMVPALLAMVVAGRALVSVAGLGTVGSAIVGFLVADVCAYGMHRLMHNWPWLWRWTHQLHHSAERVDIAGAVFFHPIDLTLQIGVGVVPVLLLGLSPDAAALAGFMGFLTAMFQHMNVRTPRWIGWIVQRPEAHSVHHARGVHAYNYGNFMLWDIVLGTFRNPTSFSETAGFWDGASGELGAMLIGRDVGQPSLEGGARSARTASPVVQ